MQRHNALVMDYRRHNVTASLRPAIHIRRHLGTLPTREGGEPYWSLPSKYRPSERAPMQPKMLAKSVLAAHTHEERAHDLG
jgi:hypothetical protein